MNMTFIKKATTASLLAASLAMGVACAEERSPIPVVTEGFRYSITPYVWLPAMNGKVDYDNVQRVDTKLNSSQLISNTDAALMLDGELHYGRWGVMGNAVYSKSSSLGSKSLLKEQGVTVNSNMDSWMGIYTVAGTYTAYTSPSVYLDALVGARFLNMNGKTQLSATAGTGYLGDTTLYSSLSVSDAIGGVKGRVRIADSNFYVPFYLDAGGGSATAKFTSQQMLGVGYAFQYVDISVLYNNLYYSLNRNNVSSYITMGGPAVAATFRF